MARYRVLEDSVIGHGLVKAGTVIEYDGKSEGRPGHNLELIKEPLPKRRAWAGNGPAADGELRPAVFDPEHYGDGEPAGAEAGGEDLGGGHANG